MKKIIAISFILTAISFGYTESMELMNIAEIEGLQENVIIGYGLVVGLDGTGDSADGSQTREFVSRIADNFGFLTDSEDWNTKNSAVVLVSGNVFPGSAVGSKIDVTVSSVFDATSLSGGYLVLTPLVGGDEEVYALASGKIKTDSEDSELTGTVSLGGAIQKEIEHSIMGEDGIIVLNVNDKQGLSVMSNITAAIKTAFPDSIESVSNYKIRINIPSGMELYDFLSGLYKIEVDVEQEPRILIDSDTGIIVAGGNVVITQAAVSLKNTDLSIGSLWGTAGEEDAAGPFKLYDTTTTVSDLVDGLNEIGASADDIVDILQMLYQNGNLKAKLVVQ